MTYEELEQLVISWGIDKDLIKRENVDKQFMKFIEEVFEFKREMDIFVDYDSVDDWFKSDDDYLKDLIRMATNMKLEMGDILVTLIILSAQLDIDLTECLERAYNKISKRKGKTIDGLFIKEEDL